LLLLRKTAHENIQPALRTLNLDAPSLIVVNRLALVVVTMMRQRVRRQE
jgi:hypothetical protein